ncbi:hypothetical protein CNMCM8686_000160 [Aspergillus fumigatus]|nr:hypothetical protein CNMCM8686_000160 [Aspergillus fumigatus]
MHAAQGLALPFRAVVAGFGAIAVRRGRHGCCQAGPEAAQQAGGGRRLGLAGGFVDGDVANQMQALAGAGRGHVQQARDTGAASVSARGLTGPNSTRPPLCSKRTSGGWSPRGARCRP